VMSEIHRILKPGGRLFLHTAGLQPLHEAPHHYFNVTKFGLEEWLRDFKILDLGVSSNFNPIYALSWIASEIEKGVAQKQPNYLGDFNKTTLADLVEFWRSPQKKSAQDFDLFFQLDLATKEICAAGWEAIVEKEA
jgi:hypothetical protein